jgi:Lectin C-type domain
MIIIIIKTSDHEKNLTIGEYWTSGTDRECNNRYHWCSIDYPFRTKDLNWAAAHPKEADGDCVYIKATLDLNSTVIATDDCSKERYFVCEVGLTLYL